ncbi:ABC transporter ATP-binding protein [Motilimonas cestriensis]|uniref:ABC transporter ATP-binding protein n=1 Tax=Motilimonas cestriensis TaxID=2742685 RepID=A0ABS8WC99_9GAMM|nr:ABC transporter ATP-binding protein [Motilimonas cestriensis]MCE2596664.1 ABC transporter ATP-binding protein [Motilimonas cestriensis]
MFQLNQVNVRRDGRDILSLPELTIATDKLTVILGHNGSGKSTLVNILAGQLKPDSGQVLLNNQALVHLSARALAQQVAYLPQRLPAASGLTVAELVKLGRFPWLGTFGRFRKRDQKIMNQAMADTDILAFKQVLADQLSGGERQRAWIAMLLAQQSPVLVLDEPTSALDVGHQYQLLALLQRLNRTTGKGVVIILHDINLALRYADAVIALKQGKVVFQGDHSSLLNEAQLSDLYQANIQLINHPTKDKKVAVVC